MSYTQSCKLPDYEYVPYNITFCCSFKFSEDAAKDAAELLSAKGVAVEWHDGLLKISKETDGDLDSVAEILSCVMEKHSIRETITLQAAFSATNEYDCLFGGIAAAVSAGEFRLFDTGQMAKELEQELKTAVLVAGFEGKFPGKLEQLLEISERGLKDDCKGRQND